MHLAQAAAARPTFSVADGDGWRESTIHTCPEISALLDTLAGKLVELNWPDRDVFAVRLCLEEAIVNGIKHGNQHDPTKHVRLRYRIEGDAFLAEVQDEGEGFDPHDLPDPTDPEHLDRPSGRGVFLMRRYMTWIRFNDRGNCVTLCKYRTVS